ncbi:hypothetical protein [Streptomyces sp. NPDC047525]|uniref:hypothetical protein n=1 Tax=Streptomyces sp. NPDC047525 TaxID=3155264 RepID=UPI00340758F8
MTTTDSSTRDQHIWFLATLGRDALLRALAPHNLPAAATRDPLSLAARCVIADPIGFPEAHRAAQTVLRQLTEAKTFSVTVIDDCGSVRFTGVVPVIGEHTAGGVTGQYAELLLLEEGGLMSKAAFRLSRMPTDTTWIIDTDFRRSGHPGAQQPFGSSRLGRKRTVLAPFASELDRLITQVQGSTP